MGGPSCTKRLTVCATLTSPVMGGIEGRLAWLLPFLGTFRPLPSFLDPSLAVLVALRGLVPSFLGEVEAPVLFLGLSVREDILHDDSETLQGETLAPNKVTPRWCSHCATHKGRRVFLISARGVQFGSARHVFIWFCACLAIVYEPP